MSGRPVTIRILDLGADKADRSGLVLGREENPALGLRGIRLLLKKPELLEEQFAAILRVAQGSATVALVTAAGLMAPAVAGAGYNPVQLACIVLATAAGSVFAGHVNDSGFWLVGRLMGMDVTTTLKVWTVQQAIESVVGFGMVCAVFGVASLV